MHDADVVGELADHTHVVCDEEAGEAKVAAEIAEQVQNLGLHRDIECAGGFIADQEFGLRDESAGDADALALTAGELRGEALEEGGRDAAALEGVGSTGELVLA